MAARGGRIQTALGLFVPCGLRALLIAGAIGRTTSAILIQHLGGIEPPTRGFSVERVTDSLFESMS